MFYSESALPNNVLIERAIDTWYTEKYGWRRSGDCTDACSYTQVNILIFVGDLNIIRVVLERKICSRKLRKVILICAKTKIQLTYD